MSDLLRACVCCDFNGVAFKLINLNLFSFFVRHIFYYVTSVSFKPSLLKATYKLECLSEQHINSKSKL